MLEAIVFEKFNSKSKLAEEAGGRRPCRVQEYRREAPKIVADAKGLLE